MDELRLPSISQRKEIVATPKRIFKNAHAYHINSISLNCDGETFLSSDDLRINWWNQDRPDTCFNVVDIKPPMMEELNRVITTAEFHPLHCNMLLYAASTGAIMLADTRKSALCENSARLFEAEGCSSNAYFADIISSISAAKFSACGRYIGKF